MGIQLSLFGEEPTLQKDVAKKRQEPQKVKNLSLAKELLKDRFGMPIIKRTDYIPKFLTAFHEAVRTTFFNGAVHFFIDDVHFERIWNKPVHYLNILKRFKAVFSPDFSTYTDMDMPYIVWNTYRNRLLGSWWQSKGITVIPTITWAGVESYDICFSGVETGGVVAVGSCPKDKRDKNMWLAGFCEMAKKLLPSKVIIYGNMPEEDLSVETVNFTNPYIYRLQNYGRVG